MQCIIYMQILNTKRHVMSVFNHAKKAPMLHMFKHKACFSNNQTHRLNDWGVTTNEQYGWPNPSNAETVYSKQVCTN